MSPLWMVLVMALALLALGVWAWRWKASRSSGRDDRYIPERILTTEQVQMLDYLHDSFPGQVVLPNMLLKDMLSIRRAANRQRAEERLRKQKVDFVVCGEDGRPAFAFDIEQHHLSNAKAKEHQAKLKNRILKTAGVRFVYLKNGLHRMPSPSDFRQQLNLAALPQPKAKEAEAVSVRQQLESQFSEFDQLHAVTAFRDSEVMGLSGLMELDQPGLSGKRPVRPERSLTGNSGFNGSSLDVRGG